MSKKQSKGASNFFVSNKSASVSFCKFLICYNDNFLGKNVLRWVQPILYQNWFYPQR